MADTATLTARLSEAEAALHRALTGTQTASIEYAGRKVAYSATAINELRAYIADLKAQLDPAFRRRRAIGVKF